LKRGLGSAVEIGTATAPHDGDAAAAHAAAPAGVEELARFFPQLDVLSFIGRGGMGAVYKARQKQLGRVVALKILPPDAGAEPAFAERFGREARALACLNHPNIVTIHDFGQTDGLFFLVMEYVDGVNLRQLLPAGRMSPREALAIVPQICDALQYAHDQGIVHRDIKPENILLDRQGRVKVADFGLAKLIGGPAEAVADAGRTGAAAGLTEAGQIMGTPQYMAPEQRLHPADVDHRADIYSLGVVFYQLLTGELPGKRIEPPSRKVHIDVRLDEVVLRALETEPQRRYQQASVLKTQVETIATTPVPAASAPSRQLQRAKALGFWFASLAFLCAAGASYTHQWSFERQARWFALVTSLSLLAAVGWGVAGYRRWRRANDLAAGPLVGYTTPQSDTLLSLLAGLLAFTPPALFVWFLGAGHRILRVDLDADVLACTGLLGLPLSAGVGVVLAWAARLIFSWTGGGRQEPAAPGPVRWCWQAIAGVAVLVLSLPLGGVAMVLLQLAQQAGGSWHPSQGEFIVTILLVGGALLTLAGATLLGWRIRRQPQALRGGAGAVAAAWFWPVMLVVLTIILPSAHVEHERWAWQMAQDVRQKEEEARARQDRHRQRVVSEAGQRIKTEDERTGTRLVPDPVSGILTDKADPSSPWNARLPSGIHLQLWAVSDHPWHAGWWQPDGSPSPLEQFSGAGLLGTFEPDRDFMVRYFALQLNSLPPDMSKLQVKLDSEAGADGGFRHYDDPSRYPSAQGLQLKEGVHRVGVKVPRGAVTASFRVGIASGAWQTTASCGMDGKMTSPPLSASEAKPDSLTVTQKPKDVIGVQAEHHVEDYEIRLAAVTTSGTVLIGKDLATFSTRYSWQPTENRTSSDFPGLQSSQVKEFQFQVRPFQWAVFRNVAMHPAQPANRDRADAVTATGYTFGPAIERVVPFGAPCYRKYFQFHTGNVFEIGDGPGDTSDHAEEWRRIEESGGVDAMSIGGKEGIQFAGKGCIFTQDSSPNWDTSTAEQTAKTLRRATWITGVIEAKRKQFPLTYLFKTARGDCGVLQIYDITEDPRGFHQLGMKLRYKFVQTEKSPATPAPKPASRE
jgi:predicted Ser/Thr protein kinase